MRHGGASRRRVVAVVAWGLAGWAAALWGACVYLTGGRAAGAAPLAGAGHPLRAWGPGGEAPGSVPPVLVVYAFFDKDEAQRRNLEFFVAVGLGGWRVEYVVAVSGDAQAPAPGILEGARVRVVRRENAGMDFGAWGEVLRTLAGERGVAGAAELPYRAFVFLNSSVRGPFLPAYMPAGWHWTDAFVGMLGGHGRVSLVGSSLACLPSVDKGGPGPVVETFAFALDPPGLALAEEAGVFETRTCKHCGVGGVVVSSEFALSKAVLAAGRNLATLMLRYRADPPVDWSDRRHWACNDNAFPSRRGSYDGIEQSPLETVFVKTAWRVAEDYVDRYTAWALRGPDTGGAFNETKYRASQKVFKGPA